MGCFLLVNGLYSSAAAENRYEQRIQKLEELLELYFDENRILKKKLIELEKRPNSSTNQTAAVSTTKTPQDGCEANLKNCSKAKLCELSTYKIGSKPRGWKVGVYRKFVAEAKRRGLTCGVKTVNSSTNQTAAVSTTKTARDRCEADLVFCNEAVLCELATYGPLGNTDWKVGVYRKFVDEAKKRNLSCGVMDLKAKAERNQQEAKEEAKLQAEAEAKRKAEEEARLTAEAEAKQKAEEEARLVAEALKVSLLIEKGRARANELLHSKKEYNNYFVHNQKLEDDLAFLYTNLVMIRKKYEYLSYGSDEMVKINWNTFNSSFPNIEEKTKILLGEEIVKKLNEFLKPLINDLQNQFTKNGDEWHWEQAFVLSGWLYSRTNCLKAHANCGDTNDTGLPKKIEKLMLSVAFLNNYEQQFQKDYYQWHDYSKPILNDDLKLGLSLPKGWSASSSNKDMFFSFAGNGMDSISIEVNSTLKLFDNLSLSQSVRKNILKAHQTSDPLLIKFLNDSAMEKGCIPLHDPAIIFRVDDLKKQSPTRYHKLFCSGTKNSHKVEFINHVYSHLLKDHWINIECKVVLQITENNKVQFKHKRTGGLDMSSLCGTVYMTTLSALTVP